MTRSSMRPSVRLVLALALVAAFAAGCSGTTSDAAAGGVRTVAAAEAVKMIDSRTVIDVRTPAEYAAGHVAGAQNIDVEAADFGSRIAALDKNAPYLLYCRSGRRSALAADQMKQAGFTDVVDAGGLDGLVAAGAPQQ
jgi:rhodanese-related sulfurtransferase